MLTYLNTDLFRSISFRNEIVVHGVNMQGVMGSGFAKSFKQNFPEAFLDYINYYDLGSLNLGSLLIHNYPNNFSVISAVSQRFYGNKGGCYVDYTALEVALRKVALLANKNNQSIHMPFIGGGLGGGNKDILMSIYQKSLNLTSKVYIYEKTNS